MDAIYDFVRTIDALAIFIVSLAIAGLAKIKWQSDEHWQTKPGKHMKPGFGASAARNIVWTYMDLEQIKSESHPTALRMRTAKWLTWLIDYAYMLGWMLFFDSWLGDDFTPEKVALVFPMCVIPGSILLDYVKGPLLFSDIVAPVKRKHMMAILWETVGFLNPANWGKITAFLVKILKGEGTLTDWSDKAEARGGALYHWWYIIKISCLFSFVPYVFASLGLFEWTKFSDVRAEFGNFKLTTWGFVYMEYLLLSFIKDSFSMHVLHKLMHERWYPMHSTHHMPMQELSNVNFIYFDVLDVMIENGIAPVLVLGMKALWCSACGGTPQLHLAAFLGLGITDINTHSVNPFTVGFYNPVLDSLMKCNISHTLHHATNKGHYTIWPFHHLSENGQDADIAEYNHIFGTKIFFHGDRAPADERDILELVRKTSSQRFRASVGKDD